MEAEAWKALKQAAIRFELKTGTGHEIYFQDNLEKNLFKSSYILAWGVDY